MGKAKSVAPKPISSADVPWQEWSEGTRFGLRYRALTRAAVGDGYRVGVAIEELAPGRQSYPAHYHIFEEEHVYVLEGALTARIGDRSYQMAAGDYVCFPAGQKAGHCLINSTDAPCRYVIVGEDNPNEVAVYTDSGKVLVRALGPRAIFDLAAWRDYWAGEETGSAERGAPPAQVEVVSAGEPARPICSRDVAWQPEGPAESTRFGGRSKHLTGAAVGERYHVGVLIEAPSPGKRLWPRHYHMLEEEHALILEGQATLLLGDERHDMTAGDYVCFPAGLEVGHAILNSGDGPCSYLMIGERKVGDVCIYPDSHKMAVSALRSARNVFDMAASRGYWDGESGG